MSLSSANNRNDYVGNGSTETYSYTFRIFDEADLRVTVVDTDGVETQLSLSTDYTVTGVGTSGGGTIVLVDANQDWLDAEGDLATNFGLTIRRVLDIVQETDIRNQGAYFPEIHEDQFDKLAMIDQQQQDELDRSLKLPETISGASFDPTLPADLPDSPGCVVIVNPAGDGFITGPTADAISGAQDDADAAAAAAAAAGVSETNAGNSASAASASASSASTSASTATTQASAASASAAAALTSENNAETAETNAETAENNAEAAALAADASADAAAISETNADASADAAAASAVAADASADAALVSETNAAASAAAVGAITNKGDLLTRDASAYTRLGVGGDGETLIADSSQTKGLKWGRISGIKNYINNPDAESNSNTGWVVYNDSAAAPVDGTGGSTSLTFSAGLTDVLRGTYSFYLTKGGTTSRLGEGVAYAFTIDRADKAKPLSISFDYEVYTGTYATGDLTVYIIDVTNSRVIQPSGYSIENVSGSAVVKATFQSSSDSVSYRLCIHVASASALDYQMKFDNVVVGPIVTSVGPAMSDLVAYTPGLTTSGGGAITLNATGPTAINGFWGRDGGDLIGSVSFKNGSGGGATGTAGTMLIGLPTGLVADTAKIATAIGGGQKVGYAQFFGGTNFSADQTVTLNSTTQMQVLKGAAAAAYAVSDIAASSGFQLNFRIPIVGWSSNSVVSSSTDTRVVAASYNSNASQATTNGGTVTVIHEDIVFDTHGAYNVATGVFTVPVAGKYDVFASTDVNTFSAAGIAYSLTIRKNSTNAYVYQGRSASTANQSANVSGVLDCNAGDTIDIRLFQNSGSGTHTISSSQTSNYVVIKRLSGPSQIAASESIAAAYVSATATLTGSTSAVTFTTKEVDTHGSYSGSTYTIPAPGIYNIHAQILMAHTTVAAGQAAVISIYKNGANYRGNQTVFQGTSTTASALSIIANGVRLNAGDTLVIQAHASTTSPVISASATGNYFGITRIGN